LSGSPVAKKEAGVPPSTQGLAEIYAQYGAFVWRNLRRMGIPEAAIDDATQDVFLVVHRRLDDFAARSQFKTWLFGIVLRVGQNYRRSWLRRRAVVADAPAVEESAVTSQSVPGPLEFVEKREAVDLLYELLAELDDEKRAMLISVELEEMSVSEASEAMGIKVNTGYSRLRAAHGAFEKIVARRKARDAAVDRKLTP
jgi:RNA polymerase sigma-70 factor (ECF subfamily)